jgi:hypothetical protein
MRISNMVCFAFLVGAFWKSSVLAQAASVTVQCPERLDVTDNATTVGDWQVYVTSNVHTFSRFRIYNGHPQGKVVLDADNASDEQPYDYRWTLGDAGDHLWVECAFHASAVRLIQPLAKGLHSCRAFKLANTLGLSCE